MTIFFLTNGLDMHYPDQYNADMTRQLTVATERGRTTQNQNGSNVRLLKEKGTMS